MAKGHGKDAHFAMEDSAGVTLRNIGEFCDSVELDRDVDMADSTTIGLEDKTFISGLAGATISLGGKWDSLITTGPDAVLAPNVGNDISVGFEYGPIGNTLGMVKYSGECYVEKYQVSSPLEGVVKFSATLRVSGPPVRATF